MEAGVDRYRASHLDLTRYSRETGAIGHCRKRMILLSSESTPRGEDSPTVVNALIKQVRHLPDELMKSLTWDRGLEMARHKGFSVATHVDVYFCDPRSPWQRGTNENTNRLLRQYFPKQSDLSKHSQADLNKVALRLNQRPRKTLQYLSPAEKFRESVALTA